MKENDNREALGIYKERFQSGPTCTRYGELKNLFSKYSFMSLEHRNNNNITKNALFKQLLESIRDLMRGLDGRLSKLEDKVDNVSSEVSDVRDRVSKIEGRLRWVEVIIRVGILGTLSAILIYVTKVMLGGG